MATRGFLRRLMPLIAACRCFIDMMPLLLRRLLLMMLLRGDAICRCLPLIILFDAAMALIIIYYDAAISDIVILILPAARATR